MIELTNMSDVRHKFKIVEEFLNNVGYSYRYAPTISSEYFNMRIELNKKSVLIENEYIRTPQTGYVLEPMIIICVASSNGSIDYKMDIENEKLLHSLKELFMYLELNNLIPDGRYKYEKKPLVIALEDIQDGRVIIK